VTDATTNGTPTLQPYDHVCPGDDADLSAGIYRVVGTGDPVVLLSVADEDGRRHNTGEVVAVSRSAVEQLESAENPDRGLSIGDFLPPVRAWATAIRHWLPL
jgi:hypothetical protein